MSIYQLKSFFQLVEFFHNPTVLQLGKWQHGWPAEALFSYFQSFSGYFIPDRGQKHQPVQSTGRLLWKMPLQSPPVARQSRKWWC